MKRTRKSWPRFVRGLLSLCVMLGICAMLCPLPSAPRSPDSQEKDSSEPFPCQNRPCGCRSAEQCWKKCCCFNNAQKVAWAKLNNVKVPDFVLVAAKSESLTEREIGSRNTSDAKGTGATKATGSCLKCQNKSVATTKASCCDKSKTPPAIAKSQSCRSCSKASVKSTKSTETRRKSASSKWVMAIYAAECQGQGPPAFCFPISTIPDRPALIMPSAEVVETFAFESERLHPMSLRPPLPPPKIV